MNENVNKEDQEKEPFDLTEEELESLEEADPSPEPVSYAGSDFDVEGLVRRKTRGDIVIPTFGVKDASIEVKGFQRKFVWRRPQMDKFIESLLLEYPIPGIFLVQQVDRRYLVLDGQQRLTTLKRFYDDEFALRDVAEEFKTLTYSNLSAEQKRTLDSTFVHATIVQTDGRVESLDTIYQIFERLNSGGTQLTPHEIRVALYAGGLVELLSELNNHPTWRQIYGRVSPRLRDQEVILRFLAFFAAPGEYKRPLKKFLNDFAAEHRDLERLDADHLKKLFRLTCDLLNQAKGDRALKKAGKNQLNVARSEAILVGLAKRLETGDVVAQSVADAIDELEVDADFERVTSRATSDEQNVRSRLAVAAQAFAKI